MNLTEKARTGQGFERRIPLKGEALPQTLSIWARQTYSTIRDNPPPPARPGSEDSKLINSKGDPT